MGYALAATLKLETIETAEFSFIIQLGFSLPFYFEKIIL